MKSFHNFFESAEDVASSQPQPKRVSDDVMTVFGRHQPPHAGHKLTFDHAHDLAQSIGDNAQADQRFYSSKSLDPAKNPLPYKIKEKFLKKMFPDHADKWDGDESVRTILGAATKAHDDGYKNFHFVGGSDRKEDMENLLRRYNGNLYNFDNIYSHSAGERNEDDPDDPIASLSASKLRNAVQNGDQDGFMGGMLLNQSFTEDDAKELFDTLKTFMVKNEEWVVDSRSHKEYIREEYRHGNLYEVGDIVESLAFGLVGKIHRCGTNHLICVTEDGIMFKNFIHDVHHI